MHDTYTTKRDLRDWCLILTCISVLWIMAPATASAGAGVGVAPDFPTPMEVGTLYPVALTITNLSDPDVGDLQINDILLNPACATLGFPCSAPDGGVFTLSATGTGTLGCDGITFSIAENPDPGAPDDQYIFTPDAIIVLAMGEECEISFTAFVDNLPAVDALPAVPGIQTHQNAGVTGVDADGFEPAQGSGNDTTTFLFNPSIAVTKDCQDVVGADTPIPFSGTITNDGDVPLTGVTLEDSQVGFITLTDTELLPGESVEYSGEYLPPTTDPTENVVTATGSYDVAGNTGSVEATAAATCEQVVPCIDVTKQCEDVVGADSPIPFSGVVSNCGDVDLIGVVVVDDAGTPADTADDQSFALGDLAVGESAPYEGSYLPPEPGAESTNVVVATGDWTFGDFSDTASATAEAICQQLICDVALDKQISCDGGATWVDIGFDDDIAESCIGLTDFDGVSGSEVLVRYRAQNVGGVDLVSCEVSESNQLLFSGTHQFDLPLDGEPFEWTQPEGQTCSSDLAAGEPDTAMISCLCAGFTPDDIVTDDDSADFDCQTPALNISKLCAEEADNVNEIQITVSNPGELDLVDCQVVDMIYLDDPTCPADMGDGTLVYESPIFDLPAGSEPQEFATSWSDLLSTSCNTVRVECDVVGAAGATIWAVADDVCEVTAGCVTRSPGFWGNHPQVAELFLPVDSCGLTLDHTLADLDGSTSEDLCFNGRDFKSNDTSPQQLQLIRQCTAAALNIAASADLGGSCASDYPGLTTMFDSCCADICTSQLSGSEIGSTGCIEWLDAFNNSEDSLEIEGTVFESPGPAMPWECKDSSGNGFVNDRDLGPASGNDGGPQANAVRRGGKPVTPN